MRNIWIIAKKEYDHYFASLIAYAVAFTILLVLGIIFGVNLWYYTNNAFQSSGTIPDSSSVTGAFVFLLVFFVPALTMHLVSDENRLGTLELLLTAPLRDHELIVGKWLGGFLFIFTLVVITLVYPVVIDNFVQPGIDWSMVLTSYLGVLLVTSAFLGLGVGISAMFSNQIATMFVTFTLFVFLWWLVGFPANLAPVGADVFRYLDMSTHFYDTLNQGVIQLGDLVYFLSLTALGLFIGTTAIEISRWR